MNKSTLMAIGLAAACSIASAQDVLLSAHVQRVILQPFGTENCPPPCPSVALIGPNGLQRVCISNAGGCQAMEVKVDRVYLGAERGETRRFSSLIGEWGHDFPVTMGQIIVREEGGEVFWSRVTERDGKLFVDARRLGSLGRLMPPGTDEKELVALDVLLARVGTGR